MSNKILVVGATGNVGHHLVELLAEQGEQVMAAARQPELYPSYPNVEAVLFDYDRPETYGPALEGVDRAFVIAKNADPEPDTTVSQLIDRGKEAGVRHIVLMTAMGVEQAGDEIGLRRVENRLVASGVDYTILRPTWFMQNFSPGFILPMIQQGGGIYLPAGDGKTSFIDTRDIAAVAAKALTEPGHTGREYALTGNQPLTYGEAAEIISRVAGRAVRYIPVSDDDMRASLSQAGRLPGQVEMMVGLFNGVRQGWAAVVSPAVKEVLGRDPITFEQFAGENAGDWKDNSA